MSLFAKRTSSSTLLAERTAARTGSSTARVSRSDALTHSVAWACVRLRADLISTMPVDIFRRVAGVQMEQAKPPIFITPDGQVDWVEWCYSTQVDLDSVGNAIGIITARDGMGLPSVIELADINEVTFKGKGSRLARVRVGQTWYEPEQVWHEKQFTLSGSPIGLSPIAHAARSIGGYLSAAQFAADWFGNSTVPGGHLKNTAKRLNKAESAAAKESFKATVAAGDIWVSGNDWEYSMLSAKASESAFLERMQYSDAEVCRFLGVPGDMVDVETSTGSVTYANVTQRNLQLLIMNIGPAIVRRETAWSRRLLPNPRYAKLNRGALLEMDLKSRYEAHGTAIDKRFLAPSEVRELENRPPFTAEQEAEFARLFAPKPDLAATKEKP